MPIKAGGTVGWELPLKRLGLDKSGEGVRDWFSQHGFVFPNLVFLRNSSSRPGPPLGTRTNDWPNALAPRSATNREPKTPVAPDTLWNQARSKLLSRVAAGKEANG
jgi:hypothetical protein